MRPTIRCLRDDLDLPLPPINDPLHLLDHPVIAKAQRTPTEVASGSAERIRSLHDWVWFKQRAGRFRAAVTELPADHQPVGGWWIGAAGSRSAGNADDVYAELETIAKREAKGTKAKTDSSWMLPDSQDETRLRLEEGVAVVLAIRFVVRRLVARSLRTGKGWTAEFSNATVSAHVRADDGEAYLVIATEGFIDPSLIANILGSIPDIPADDWLAEPGGAAGVQPAPGQIIYSTLIPTNVQDKILDEFPDEGSL
ncbi:hypothetical protein GC089_16285 [Cellulomonas sp. JZ18]|uniref:hypothetical protein n=1 Tax=Cellulomonas sp. JZ18 TaxID=2654191 RepID=UPI0012D44246|nr:hypothetical protein [Cellulomonas sp. JZ18]QGQ20462.1 hypothetical protein GC089_16285 [Cellulomonas sp. JZ18]